jgi:hypothetical protein
MEGRLIEGVIPADRWREPYMLGKALKHEIKDQLLKQYWIVPERQVETSVVLVDAKWRARLLSEEVIK